jgi:hypothetical protein
LLIRKFALWGKSNNTCLIIRQLCTPPGPLTLVSIRDMFWMAPIGHTITQQHFLISKDYILIFFDSLSFVLDTWYLILDTWYLMLDTWCLILDAWYLIPDTWCLILDSPYFILDTWYLILVTWNLILFPTAKNWHEGLCSQCGHHSCHSSVQLYRRSRRRRKILG